MKLALAQIAPVLLDREATLEKVLAAVNEAADQGARMVVFGEALVPGYPVWLERTGGARFDDPLQKALHARYLDQAVCVEAGHLDGVRALARERSIAVVLGVIERPLDRGGHSLYCSLCRIDPQGELAPVHRKLMPTYEERLAWSTGDAHGLSCFDLDGFRVGALLCWENWMPLARTALYADGEDLHLALWPGGEHNTRDLTRFLAREGRSFVVSVSGLMRPSDVPRDVPAHDAIVAGAPDFLCNGGSAVAAPDGTWLLEPVVGEECVRTVTLDRARVLEERQNFDPVGHYSRPDCLRLLVDRRRQTSVEWRD